ncbi:hypothetical protein MIND_00471600 [Mycena indigotica]|uniref:Peroxisomal membrane protein PMP22 n=1 Tax=Mycena indigotica TaxID=2126181 RepID=A0A8H6SWS7_9AGAR|nr:uncharacterized protein MIND_00471600 [Mycena indigotica]KAF7306799.1 hypothetical protein MIND_00471600 [Mycena indigotica]
MSTTKYHPLLAKYLQQVAQHPLRTKALTTGILCFLQEILGSKIAGLPAAKTQKDTPLLLKLLARNHVDIRAVKMGVYGFLVSAPLSHYLMGLLQKAFAGKTSAGAKVGQLLANNFLIAPIQTAAYLASLAVIGGAKSLDEIVKTVKVGFFPVIRVTWVVTPTAMLFAQRFVPMELWTIFFSAVSFVIGTVFNARVKRIRLAAAKKAQKDKDEAEKKKEE